MTILVVDNNEKDLKKIKKQIASVCDGAEIFCFDDSLAALAKARESEIDVAFLAPVLPELGGFDLGQYLKDLYPFVNLIYITEQKDYAYEAMKLHASGYLLKPTDGKNVKKEFEELRYPEAGKMQKRVFAQTFGNFEFFVDGKPVEFKYNRSKEIVAVLINNRGAQTTNGEIIACLWEDEGNPDKKRSYLSNLRQDLQNTLRSLKVDNIILKKRGSMAIAVDKIECDLYDWLDKKKESRYNYLGDYMNQYSWPEYVHAELDEISYALYDE